MSSARAVVGAPYTFWVLIVDADGSPFLAELPTISVFAFDEAGVKITYVDGAAMSTAVPADPGRYTYVFNVSSAFSAGMVLHAEIRAVDPVSGDIFITESNISLVSSSSSSSSGSSKSNGLNARFIKGG